jgi:hypothetical protein
MIACAALLWQQRQLARNAGGAVGLAGCPAGAEGLGQEVGTGPDGSTCLRDGRSADQAGRDAAFGTVPGSGPDDVPVVQDGGQDLTDLVEGARGRQASARITQWAMLCARAGRPIAGAFATWRNVPITFDSTYDSSITVSAANYLAATPDSANLSIATCKDVWGDYSNSGLECDEYPFRVHI